MVPRTFPKKVLRFEGKRVSVFGMGVSGLSATDLLLHLGCQVKVVDRGPFNTWKNWRKVLEMVDPVDAFPEEEAAPVFASSDLIILSPGIPLEHPALSAARARKVPIWSEIELAYQFADVPIFCVTGTNGKTTTVSLIAELFKQAGLSAFVGGNIGHPFCQYVLEKLELEHEHEHEHKEHAPNQKLYDFIVLELSSFQLETIHNFHPQIAVITNIEQNHGERYKDLLSYAMAKLRVTMNMVESDILIYPLNNSLIHDFAQMEPVKALGFDREMVLEDLSFPFDLSNFALTGWHNWENLYCAKKVLEQVVESPETVRQIVQRTIEQFKGVPHRLERVETTGPYKVYNDAKSTNLAATATALQSLSKDGTPIYLIFGGKKREEHPGDAYTAKEWTEAFSGVAKIFLIGETTDDLAVTLGGIFSSEGQDQGSYPMTISKAYTLQRVKEEVDKEGFQGTLLLSPGFPSFDQFENYAQRGDFFKALFIPTP